MMRIVIDMQGAQTESRYRGIGRYTMDFARAVVRNRGEHEILLALSGLFPDTIEPIRAAFDGLLPQENIRVWYAPGPVKDEDPSNTARREVAELVREAFLASLCPDIVHVCSLFEGYVDDAVTSIGRFDDRTPVSVTLYDLIPLLNPDQYLKPNTNFAAYYERKLKSLRTAKQYFAISEYSRQEGLNCLGVDTDRIVNVSTAIGPEFQPINVDFPTQDLLKRKIGLRQPFVLYTGGCDERKNLPRLIEAWSKLSIDIRRTHQLVFAGRMPAGNAVELREIARRQGLNDGEFLFSGYVSDEELVQLYNLCKLFVFPSWHEGFGLPALEAMACGAPVIGANTTSLPEVIGLEDALFDPFEVKAITAKIERALTDESYLSILRAHGLEQSTRFSWNSTAQRAIGAWESLHVRQPKQSLNLIRGGKKPKLAYVSPIPPERTGIADYSAALLPALSAYYDIELVVAQEQVDDQWVSQNCRVRDESWLRSHAYEIDRVLYQMGNSPFHRHMLPLLEEVPGTVVLHDFYLSGLLSWEEQHGGSGGAWILALYDSHGYHAVCSRSVDEEETKRLYPVNWQVLQHAHGIIVHSDYSRKLAQTCYHSHRTVDWEMIPLVRTAAEGYDRQSARKSLGIAADAFVACSFGLLDATKLNHRLVKAWLDSALVSDPRSLLIFVGENHGGEYGAALRKTISDSGLEEKIRITGFATGTVYRKYLAAADVAVQLRTSSRGETSAAVFDCMNYGLPLIVNANGSMAELDPDAAWILSDGFSDADLTNALEILWRDSERRNDLGQRARQIVLNRHAPAKCARQYAEAIERFHYKAQEGVPGLVDKIALQSNTPPDQSALLPLSQALAKSFPAPAPAKRLFLDITATCNNDLKTGIERVARAITIALIESPPKGYRVEPVYLSEADGVLQHYYARDFTLELLGCPTEVLVDEPIDPQNGDIILTLDISEYLVRAEKDGLFLFYRGLGIAVYSIVYDLLGVRMPEVFPPGADEMHREWLGAVSKFDGAICISSSVADDLNSWLLGHRTACKARRPFRTRWWHLGADFENSASSNGLQEGFESVLENITARPTFLMVGTIEPRKGYLQVIEAFSQLWAEGVDVNLVIVGREGWNGLPDEMRRTIPEIITQLRTHEERGRRLIWLEGVSDEYLEKVYAVSTCLIAASYGEGFGLPLFEAAHHGLPIIARDIPVFREVASDCAFFIQASTSKSMAASVKAWLRLFEQLDHPKSENIKWLTWKQSAAVMSKELLGAGAGNSLNE